MGNATVTPLSTSAPIATKLLTRDEARRIAADIAKLPDLHREPQT